MSLSAVFLRCRAMHCLEVAALVCIALAMLLVSGGCGGSNHHAVNHELRDAFIAKRLSAMGSLPPLEAARRVSLMRRHWPTIQRGQTAALKDLASSGRLMLIVPPGTQVHPNTYAYAVDQVPGIEVMDYHGEPDDAHFFIYGYNLIMANEILRRRYLDNWTTDVMKRADPGVQQIDDPFLVPWIFDAELDRTDAPSRDDD